MWYANISRYIHVSMFFISRNSNPTRSQSSTLSPEHCSPCLKSPLSSRWQYWHTVGLV